MDAPERDLPVSGRLYDESVTRACNLLSSILSVLSRRRYFPMSPPNFKYMYRLFLSWNQRLPTSRPTTFETHRSCCAAYR